MSAIAQSIVFGGFSNGKTSDEEVIAEAGRIGFSSVEMLPQKYWPLVRKHGMEIAVVMGHASLQDGLNNKDNHDRIESELLANIDIASREGISGLICFSGNREGRSDEEGLENTTAGLKRVAAAAEKKGVTLVLELLNSKVNHPDYHCDRTWWGVEVCRRISCESVKLLYDIYHMQIMEGDLIRTIEDHIDFIAHFHTAGNPGRNDIDDEQEIYYPPIMRAIASTGYTGFVGHEFKPKGDISTAMRAAYTTCNV